MSTDRTTEILNLLSALSREIGAFRAEVNARFDRLEARVGNVETRMDGLETRVGNLETEMRSGFEKVHTEMRIMNRKFGVFAKDFMELRAYQLDLEKRTEVLEKKAGIADSV